MKTPTKEEIRALEAAYLAANESDKPAAMRALVTARLRYQGVVR